MKKDAWESRRDDKSPGNFLHTELAYKYLSYLSSNS